MLLGVKYRLEKEIDTILITFMESFSRVENTIDLLNDSMEKIYTKYKNVITVPYLITIVSYRLDMLYPVDKCIIAILGVSSKKYFTNLLSEYILVNKKHIKLVTDNTVNYLYELDNPSMEIVSFTESLLNHFTKEYLKNTLDYNKFYDDLFSVIITKCSDMESVIDIIVSKLDKTERTMVELALINKLDLVSLQELVMSHIDLQSSNSLEDNYYMCSELEERILATTVRITQNIIDVIFDIINKYTERHIDNPDNKLAQIVMESIIYIIIEAIKKDNEYVEPSDPEDINLQFDKAIRALFDSSSESVELDDNLEFSNNIL